MEMFKTAIGNQRVIASKENDKLKNDLKCIEIFY